MTDPVIDLKEVLYSEAIDRELRRPKCWDCEYLDGPYLYDDLEKEDELVAQNLYGFCHREPAKANRDSTEEGSYVWPQVDGDGWCADFKPRSLDFPTETPSELQEDVE